MINSLKGILKDFRTRKVAHLVIPNPILSGVNVNYSWLLLLVLILTCNYMFIVDVFPEKFFYAHKLKYLSKYTSTYFFGNILFLVLGELYERKLRPLSPYLPAASIIFLSMEPSGLHRVLTRPRTVTDNTLVFADLLGC